MANKQRADIPKSPGRPKGSPNKTTALLKDAIITAAEIVGSDGQGKGKLTGYLTFLAKTEPKAFAGLLAKVMPTQISGDPDNPVYAVIEQRIVDPQR